MGIKNYLNDVKILKETYPRDTSLEVIADPKKMIDQGTMFPIVSHVSVKLNNFTNSKVLRKLLKNW